MANLVFKKINKMYNARSRALIDFNLEIKDGEFVVLVGPSGCGKSTILRMIAGLEEVTTGEFLVDGKLYNEIEPKNRNIAMVFQNYALYPHLTVYENIAFGLRFMKVNREEIDRRVLETAKLIGVEELLSRKPGKLSGGQKQRVALGRAIIRRPQIFLLDEPLSNLDAQLRVQMRAELSKLHKQLGTTFVYVTHDQVEAMTMATKIVVLKNGVTQQIGTPKQIYDEPQNVFVSTFIGNPPMNILHADLLLENGKAVLSVTPKIKIHLPDNKLMELNDPKYIGEKVLLGLRPNSLYFIAHPEANRENEIIGTIALFENYGSETIYYLKVEGLKEHLIVSAPSFFEHEIDKKVAVYVDPQKIHLFDKKSTEKILGVPPVNVIHNLTLEQENSLLHVHIGNHALSFDAMNRLVHPEAIGQTISVGIKPEHMSLTPSENAFAIKGTVAHVVPLNENLGIFLHVYGIEERIALYVPKATNLAVGDPLTVYVHPEDIILYDEKLNRLLARIPLSENRFDVTLSNEGKDVLLLGKAHKLPNSLGSNGLAQIKIVPANIQMTKKHAKSGISLKALILDADPLGEETVIYCKLKGYPEYFTAIVHREFDMHLNPQVILFIPYENVVKVA